MIFEILGLIIYSFCVLFFCSMFRSDNLKHKRIIKLLRNKNDIELKILNIGFMLQKIFLGIFKYLHGAYLVIPIFAIFIKFYTKHYSFIYFDVFYFLTIMILSFFYFLFKKISKLIRTWIFLEISIIISFLYALKFIDLISKSFIPNTEKMVIIYNELPYRIFMAIYFVQAFFVILSSGISWLFHMTDNFNEGDK